MANLTGVKVMNKKFLVTVISSTILTACGGGGGGSETSSTPLSTSTGVFLDSPVAGLNYQTTTQSGLTNAQGEFVYIEGETITFYIGGTQLGVTLAEETITPFSLLGITPLGTEFEITKALSATDVNSFDRALNIATLLQTLDSDGNPENGIDLGDSHELLESISISLNVKANNFENLATLNQAKQITGISSERSYGQAAQHIYESLGVTIESNLAATFTTTQNNLQLDSINYEYNAEGRLTTENTDRNNDGEIDIVKTFGYDNNGNLTSTSNSSTNTAETLTYDSNNNILTRFIDKDQENDSQESYQYSNNKLEQFDLDKDADGTVETSTRYYYNDQGNITRYEVDQNGDGEAESVSSYEYLNNELFSYSEDKDNDQIPNLLISYTYDQNGNRTSQNVDLSADGTPNSVGSFTYDSNNNPVRYEQDRNLDGQADYIEAYTYDQNSNRTIFKRDLDADGHWDFYAQYFYDRNGKRVKMIEDSDGNGIVDKVWTGEYEAANIDNNWDTILEQL